MNWGFLLGFVIGTVVATLSILALSYGKHETEISGKDLRLLAWHVQDAHLKNGGRILDASDFKAWLLELANEAEQDDAA